MFLVYIFSSGIDILLWIEVFLFQTCRFNDKKENSQFCSLYFLSNTGLKVRTRNILYIVNMNRKFVIGINLFQEKVNRIMTDSNTTKCCVFNEIL